MASTRPLAVPFPLPHVHSTDQSTNPNPPLQALDAAKSTAILTQLKAVRIIPDAIDDFKPSAELTCVELSSSSFPCRDRRVPAALAPPSLTYPSKSQTHPHKYHSIDYTELKGPITMGQQLASPAQAGDPPLVSFTGTDATKLCVSCMFGVLGFHA